jgi:hypothetical protein
MKRIVAMYVFLILATASFAQDAEKEKLRQLEQQREFERSRKVRQQMDSGVYYMDHEEFELAESKFMFALNNMKSIPSDLTFFFGKNSYFMGKYKQSVDWLTKYIQLKGTSGAYSAEAIEWKKKSEAGLVEQHKGQSVRAVETLSKDYVIDCGPGGKVTCPVCGGTTVIIKKGYMGETYSTCQYCDNHGQLTCDQYNQLIRGQLKASNRR